jgi:hypothetical protein
MEPILDLLKQSYTYQCAEVVPDFGDVGVQSNCPGVCVECITVLVDLIIKHSN